MADSLLHHLLLNTVPNFNEQNWLALNADKKRILLSELYDALMRDPVIMPLLVNVILQCSPLPDLVTELRKRILDDFNRIP
jgi:hypothetical protein